MSPRQLGFLEPIPDTATPHGHAPAPYVPVETTELERRKSKKARILALLQSRESVTNVDLNDIAFRFGARIKELRDEGWIINTEQVTLTLFRFRLIGKKAR